MKRTQYFDHDPPTGTFLKATAFFRKELDIYENQWTGGRRPLLC